MTARLYLSFLTLFVCLSSINAQNSYKSVLAEGDIYKLSVQESGIYTLDYNFLANTLGLDMSALNPENIHIYSNPGGPVPQFINDTRVDDLNELAVFISGEEDGRFDQEDYIMLYAEGPNRYKVESENIVFERNIYDLRNYLFLKVEGTPGRRIAQAASVNAEVYSENRETVIRHETESRNLLADFSGTQGSGQQWFGEAFANQRVQDFSSSFSFPDLVPGSTVQLETVLTARSDATSEFSIRVGNQTYGTTHSATRTGDIEALYARSAKIEKSFIPDDPEFEVVIEYQPVADNSEAWLDYIQMTAVEKIRYSGNPLWLHNTASLGYDSFGFNFQTTSNPFIWNISDITDLRAVSYAKQGSTLSFGYDTGGKISRFLVFEPTGNYPQPVFEGMIANQNLHDIDRADFIIIYHPLFEDAAVSLATHREQHDGMEVKMVNILDIYNEFGGGRVDASAVRDFARMVYLRDPQFKYLLLLGDATYDYRGLDAGVPNHNFVPTFQTRESLNPITAFPSDDFFALLSPNEGDDSLNGALDLGVGRIPCVTPEEADAVVNKIIHYDTSPACFGDWRMRIGFAADDQDISPDRIHVAQADGIARLTETNHPIFNQQKIYFDAFTQVATPGGQRYPDAKARINDNMNSGMLVMSYLGHGGSKGLAQERVLQVSDIQSWKSFDNLAILITATCSFTGFDEPTIRSAGEYAILNPTGGAIALFSTVRAVYSSSNERLTRELYKKIFTMQEGHRLTFGDIIRESQNANSQDTTNANSRKFMLIGDPSLTIALPEHKIQVDSINGKAVDPQDPDTLGALDKAIITGSVVDNNDLRLSDFNGELFLTVYDKKTQRKTLDNDNQGSTFSFETQNSVLYKGKASVTNGRFRIEFILPKDINFDYGFGKLSLYATDNATTDAGGYYSDIVIGGISENTIDDNEGPDIAIFMDDRSFISGDLTGSDPLLIVDLEDENGINLSATSIGHDITATLDDDLSSQIILNEYYQPETDRFGAGTVEYRLSDLEPGIHSIRIKAWDILNNSSEAMVTFEVTEDKEGYVRDVYNYPNPILSDTRFAFSHDLANTDLDISIDIFSLSGQHVVTIEDQVFGASGTVDGIYWNGRSGSGDYLANGIYIYKINLYSSELNVRRESDFEKLVILN